MVKLQVKRVHPDAKLPWRSRSTDAGYDIASIEEIILSPGKPTLVRTGLKLAAPPGWYYTIDGRSGLWLIGIEPNRGIVDAAYTGDLVVNLVNFSDTPYKVEKGERIAQIVLHQQHAAEFDEIKEFTPEYSQRGENGFGSSGKK